jgi:hypothetical protein
MVADIPLQRSSNSNHISTSISNAIHCKAARVPMAVVARPNYWMREEAIMILIGLLDQFLALYDIIKDRLSRHLFLIVVV